MATEVHRVVDGVWRIESAKLIATIARMVRDVGLAEELAQEALVAALEQWPESGVPDSPGAWLTAVAKRRAIDHFRREETFARKASVLGVTDTEESFEAEVDETLDDDIGDNLLRLVFTSCHPVLPAESRVALTLRLLGGLTTEEIARAYLAAEPTIAQRIVRAKRTLAEKEIPFEVPSGIERDKRIASVLEVIYAIFNEGYSATAGSDWTRPALCEEAMRLGRIVASLMPDEPEIHGLVALVEIQASRLGARTSSSGEPITLLEQNRALWNQLLIQQGLTALDHAERLGGEPGPYTLQAAIAACHARALAAAETDWEAIASLYDHLVKVMPSPVVELNRAVAVSMAFGPAAGLEIVNRLLTVPALARYHLLPAVRGDFLKKLGRLAEARAEFERAASLTRNEAERKLMLERAHE